jgi:carboxyl-terminal processing protease
VAGAVVATAVVAQAVPGPTQRRQRNRYRTLDTFAQAVSYISNNYVDAVSERELMYGAIRGMTRRLDAHSTFLPPRRYTRLRQDTEGEFAGVGITLSKQASQDGWPVVDSVVVRSPAARVGVASGDLLTSINGASTKLGKNQRPRRYHTALRGRSGTRVRIAYKHDKKPARVVTLVRERVKIPTVESFMFGKTRVGYIGIKKFQEATHADVRAALFRIHKATKGKIKGLVLDLRANPGGLLDQGVRVADLFLDKGLIVRMKGRTRSDNGVENAHKPGTWLGFNIIVLVDKGTASAAEILAGALQGNKRAKVYGLKSYGKGSVQTFLDLKDGSGLKLTTARFYTAAGAIEGTGIKPDLKVEAFAPDDIMAGDDDSSGTNGGAASGISAKLAERLEDDNQLKVAYQKLRGAVGSKAKK